MNLERVTAGRDVPNDVNVIIEIPMNADPVKYEVDKETGAVFVDRFMSTAMLRCRPVAAAAKKEILDSVARFRKSQGL